MFVNERTELKYTWLETMFPRIMAQAVGAKHDHTVGILDRRNRIELPDEWDNLMKTMRNLHPLKDLSELIGVLVIL
ncbi:hypothetical protein D3C86_2029700 [compost metagenome]